MAGRRLPEDYGVHQVTTLLFIVTSGDAALVYQPFKVSLVQLRDMSSSASLPRPGKVVAPGISVAAALGTFSWRMQNGSGALTSARSLQNNLIKYSRVCYQQPSRVGIWLNIPDGYGRGPAKSFWRPASTRAVPRDKLRQAPQRSAVGTAAGFAPLSIGAEADGSIVQPAVRAALYGLKGTVGDANMAGTQSGAALFDSAGPIAKSVEGCADRNFGEVMEGIGFAYLNHDKAAMDDAMRETEGLGARVSSDAPLVMMANITEKYKTV
ncbi:hypothetical protein F5Y06DRAFT_293034 [Hypoxylon sp. FL0890]|nr:hypothetical protein F5Y06DRAFT_293034 [Hypoxylon sp. FL0890]